LQRLVILLVMLATTTPLGADTIYQATARGREQVVQRQAIVVHQDADEIIYKHFNLSDHRVERVRLNQGSLAYSVVVSSAAGRQQIVSLWKEFGYTAAVTDVSGKTTTVYDAYIDYYPPHGVGSLFQVIPAVTSFPIQLADGGADLASFSKVARAQLQKGHLVLTLRTGRVEQGTYLMPAGEPVEARFLGITDRYDPSSPEVFDFSLPLDRIKEIVFNP
jgi:hypothetical protein